MRLDAGQSLRGHGRRMATIFWNIIGLVLVLTGAIIPLSIFMGWLLVVVLTIVLIGMILKRALPVLVLIGLAAAAVAIVPSLREYISTMSSAELVVIAIYALVGAFLLGIKIKDSRRLQAIRDRKAGDA